MKTICIYSKNINGWMSAAIVKKWFEKQECKGQFFIKEANRIIENVLNKNTLQFFGWDHGDEIPDLSSYDKVIMVDISFPKEEMIKLSDKLIENFIWIDHHISAINDNKDILTEDNMCHDIRDTKFASCELTWQYFFPMKKYYRENEMPEIVRLLGRYDCLSSKELRDHPEYDTIRDFHYAAKAMHHSYECCYDSLFNVTDVDIENWLNIGNAIYVNLCIEAEQIYTRAFPVVFKEPYDEQYGYFDEDVLAFQSMAGGKYTTGIRTAYKNRNFLCVNQKRFNPINFGIDYHKDGHDGFVCFWYENNKWNFNLYNDNSRVDCSAICKDKGGGGNKEAAGMVLNTEQLLFLLKINYYQK